MSFVLAERTYTSYAVYDSFDDTDISYVERACALINCLETKAILITRNAQVYLKVYDIDNKTVSSSTELESSEFYTSTVLAWIHKQTFLNTYAAFIEKTTTNLLIYKDGVLIQTLTPTDLGITVGSLSSVSFSPRGKYIFLTGTRTASGNSGWVVLKGS